MFVYLIILILSFSWWLWRVWNLYLYCFSKLYHFPVFVPIPFIDTIFLYSYWSPISISFSCMGNDPLYRYFSCIVISIVLIIYHAITWHMTLTYYHLTPIWYHLSPDMPDIWPIIITIREWWPDVLTYPDIFIPVQIVLLIHLYSWHSWQAPSHSRTLIII